MIPGTADQCSLFERLLDFLVHLRKKLTPLPKLEINRHSEQAVTFQTRPDVFTGLKVRLVQMTLTVGFRISRARSH